MRKTVIVLAAAVALLAGCSANDDDAVQKALDKEATSSGSTLPRSMSPRESAAIRNDTQYYNDNQADVAVVVPVLCQTHGIKARADIKYPGGNAEKSGYKVSRSVYPRGEDVVLGMFTKIDSTGCTLNYLVAQDLVSTAGPALLAQPYSGHWKITTPQPPLAEGGFASYEVRVKPNTTSYLLFKAISATTASKPVTLAGYEAGRYTDLKESPEKLLK